MTRLDLLDVLKKEYGEEYVEENEFDVEEAIWWFANDFYDGQGSSLYEVLCSSKYKPGLTHDGPTTAESRKFYQILKNFLFDNRFNSEWTYTKL